MDSIRAGKLEDAAEMAEIFNHYVRTSTVIFSNRELSDNDMRQKLESLGVGTEFPFLVSVDNNGVLTGYCYAHRWMPDPVYGRSWELTMYLSHKHLGKGLGTRLLDRLIEECRKGGAHALITSITEGNAASEKMCVSAGFNLVGRLPEIGFKFGCYLNDVIYQKLL